MSSMQIQQVLAEMRSLQARVSGAADLAPGVGVAAAAPASGPSPNDFASLMKHAVDEVSGMQNQATSMAAAYESGDKSVDLTRVMLEAQKASLAFHAMTEVRNKLIDAYTQVMSMSV